MGAIDNPDIVKVVNLGTGLATVEIFGINLQRRGWMELYSAGLNSGDQSGIYADVDEKVLVRLVCNNLLR